MVANFPSPSACMESRRISLARACPCPLQPAIRPEQARLPGEPHMSALRTGKDHLRRRERRGRQRRCASNVHMPDRHLWPAPYERTRPEPQSRAPLARFHAGWDSMSNGSRRPLLPARPAGRPRHIAGRPIWPVRLCSSVPLPPFLNMHPPLQRSSKSVNVSVERPDCGQRACRQGGAGPDICDREIATILAPGKALLEHRPEQTR